MASVTVSSPLTLQGKVAIVTGASRGIGAGLAIELARRGAKIAIVYTSPSSEALSKDLASKIESLNNGSAATIIQADLSQTSAPEKIVTETREAFGEHIDILINNAGVGLLTPITAITPEDYAKTFDINVRAPFLLTSAVVPYLRAPGRIINISSIGARMGMSNFSLYAASKAAIEALTRVSAHELGEKGHTVNAVAPGPVESDMMSALPKEVLAAVKQGTAVENRTAKPDDIARIVAFLASEDGQWVSGQTISASGGFALY